MKKKYLSFLAILLLLLPFKTASSDPEDACISCHRTVTPGIVEQWQNSKMSSYFSCDTCHGSEHTSPQDAARAKIPTPETCKACHSEKVEEFRAGKHSLAWTAMKAMPMITHQPTPIVSEGYKGCAGCHKIGDKSEEELATFRYGTGSCDSCHTRHKFSKEEAKDPRACQTCHMGFDHPQWEMWSSSKHGVIFSIEGDTGRAPTCQKCHMKDGSHKVMTAWGFLALRLPEDDEEWLQDRVEILKALGVLDDEGNPTERLEIVKVAKVARLTKEEFQEEREKMIEVCKECHSESYVREQFEASDEIIREIDSIFAEAIRIVKALYDDGILEKPEDWQYAPDLLQFYEAKTPIEQDLYLIFLEYRMRAFQGAFHMNPDYMHWYGWAPAKETLVRIKDEAERMRREAEGEKEKAGQQGIVVLTLFAIALYGIWRKK